MKQETTAEQTILIDFATVRQSVDRNLARRGGTIQHIFIVDLDLKASVLSGYLRTDAEVYSMQLICAGPPSSFVRRTVGAYVT